VFADASVRVSPSWFGPRICAISTILVWSVSRSATAIALLLVPRSIPRLKRGFIGRGPVCAVPWIRLSGAAPR